MQWQNSSKRYGAVSVALHWGMVLLIAGVYILINLHSSAGRTPAAARYEQWHSMLGLLVLLLVVVRLLLRLIQPTPLIEPPLVSWQRRLAGLAHIALYGFMLVMPLLGWLLLSAEGHDISFFGLPLPALTVKDRPFAKTVAEVHETVGNLGYALIGLHAAAALFHHYFVKDNTLLRMLPKG